MPQIEVIAKKVEILRPLLDRGLLRLWAATDPGKQVSRRRFD